MGLILEYECHQVFFSARTLEVSCIMFWNPPASGWREVVHRDDRPDWIKPFEKFIRENAHVIDDIVESTGRTTIYRSELS